MLINLDKSTVVMLTKTEFCDCSKDSVQIVWCCGCLSLKIQGKVNMKGGLGSETYSARNNQIQPVNLKSLTKEGLCRSLGVEG